LIVYIPVRFPDANSLHTDAWAEIRLTLSTGARLLLQINLSCDTE
jgi:hypothetical protein